MSSGIDGGGASPRGKRHANAATRGKRAPRLQPIARALFIASVALSAQPTEPPDPAAAADAKRAAATAAATASASAPQRDFVNKWLSADGRDFVIVHTRNDRWATIEGRFQLARDVKRAESYRLR